MNLNKEEGKLSNSYLDIYYKLNKLLPPYFETTWERLSNQLTVTEKEISIKIKKGKIGGYIDIDKDDEDVHIADDDLSIEYLNDNEVYIYEI